LGQIIAILQEHINNIESVAQSAVIPNPKLRLINQLQQQPKPKAVPLTHALGGG
jgi:hypothetical protein